MVSEKNLKNIDIFKGLNDAQLSKIARLGLERHLEAGTTCFMQGEKANNLHLCVSGYIDIKFWLRTPWGIEVTVDSIKDGESFGWEALLEPIYVNTAKCVKKTTEITINSLELLNLFNEDPKTGYTVFNNLLVEMNFVLHQDQQKITSVVPFPLSLVSGETESEYEVRKLLEEGESTNAVFRKQLNINNDSEAAEFVRDILGLANTKSSGRRFLIIGFDSSTKSFTQSVNPNLTRRFLEQTLETYAEPAPKIIYKNVPLASGVIEIIEVMRESNKVPYRIKKDLGGSKGIISGEIYVRHCSVTEIPTEREIKNMV